MERHLGGAPGARLRLLGEARSRVGVKIGGTFASSREGQKLLWTTCNLLCRLKGVVSEVEVCAPEGTAVAEPNMVRQAAWSGDLLGSLKGALGARTGMLRVRRPRRPRGRCRRRRAPRPRHANGI